MATATEPLIETEATEAPYPITSEVYLRMVEAGLIPEDRPVYLWEGRLFEKTARSMAYFAYRDAAYNVIARRLPGSRYASVEMPVRLDERNTWLPDLSVIRGQPLALIDLQRYPEGREVELVVEVAVTGLPSDMGSRLARCAATLPNALYVVADVKNRRIIVHRRPHGEPAGYGEVETIGPGQAIRLTVGGVDLAPIPFEDLMG
jgi:Uma2 family endonuclease